MRLTPAELARILSTSDVTLVTDTDAYTTIEPRPGTRSAATQMGISSEHDLQCAVVAACDALAATDDRYGLVHAIPNGGGRSKAEGGRLKAEGVRAGIPDLFIPVPVGMQHGMYIELKWGTNKPSQAQLEWIRRLRSRGYRVDVIWDNVQAVMDAIADYLGEP